MATYAIGDIQGCFDELMQLLGHIGFNPDHDRLWFAGDLVNRGPKSLETLRYIRQLGDRAITVLGNHDLHLLAVWRRKERHFHSNSTLQPIFTAPDCDELLHWLRQRPLLHHDPALGYTMIHAGLPPQWDLAMARDNAAEVEAILRDERFEPFLEAMYGNQPALWREELRGWERARFIVNCFTRLRYCSPRGELEFVHKGSPEGASESGLLPWFRAPDSRWLGTRIVFGHWSTLGLHKENGAHAVDTGCLWGGQLSALRLEDGKVFQHDCPESCHPKGV